jgi:hypothetical protein
MFAPCSVRHPISHCVPFSAPRAGQELEYHVESCERPVDHLASMNHTDARWQPPPWAVFLEPPCGTPYVFVDLCCGLNVGRACQLLRMSDYDLVAVRTLAEVATDRDGR